MAKRKGHWLNAVTRKHNRKVTRMKCANVKVRGKTFKVCKVSKRKRRK